MELENKLSHVHHQEYEHLSGATGRTWLTSVWGNYSPEGFSLTIYKVIGKHIFPLKAMQFSIFKSVLHEANIKRQHFFSFPCLGFHLYLHVHTQHNIRLCELNVLYLQSMPSSEQSIICQVVSLCLQKEKRITTRPQKLYSIMFDHTLYVPITQLSVHHLNITFVLLGFITMTD